MNDKVLGIVSDVNKNSKTLAVDEIIAIFESLISSYSLEEYCKNFELTDKESLCHIMGYKFDDKLIIINYEKMIEGIKESMQFFKHYYKTNISESIEMGNFKILSFILHELIHMKQNQIIIDHIKNTDLLFLLSLSNLCTKIHSIEFYNQHHDDFYDEYHADINANYILINTVFDEIAKDKTNIKYFFNTNLAIYLTTRYKIKDNIIISPITKFSNVCLTEEMKNETIELISIVNKSCNNINDLLCGRNIDNDIFDYFHKVAVLKKRTLNLFSELYPNNN